MPRRVLGGPRSRPGRHGAPARLLGAAGAALLSSFALTSCYTLVPVEESSLAPRQEVRVWLNPQGEAAVAPVLGSAVKSLEGRVVRVGPGGLALRVPVGARQEGFHTEVLHQEVLLAPAQMTMLQRRELDRARTAVVVGGAGAALAAVAWVAMTGWTGASSDYPGGDDAPQARIPIFSVPLR